MQKGGAFESRLREYSFDEVVAANAAGGRLILIDGMVLDVARWLPEHPGGATIIPRQALNVEAGRFFEVRGAGPSGAGWADRCHAAGVSLEPRVLPLSEALLRSGSRVQYFGSESERISFPRQAGMRSLAAHRPLAAGSDLGSW
jgi:hypothetical protein